MKTRWKLLTMSMVTLAITILFYACKKEDSMQGNIPAGKQKVTLFLTDGPGFFDSVFIDIKSVQVLVDTCDQSDSTHGGRPCHHDGFNDDDHDNNGNNGDHHGDNGDHNGDHSNTPDSCKVWTNLDVQPGVYNLLSLSNGLDTLLASGLVPKGVIKYIKIELGPNNSLVKDSVTYPLNLPPDLGSSIIIKLKGNEWDQVSPGHLQLWLDFDVARSIIRVRDNMFYLRPFIYLYAVRVTGTVQGKVVPREAFPVLTLFNSQDTAYALPNREGEFKIRGLNDGDYSLFVNASNGYQDTTINNISVAAGKVVKLGTIELHK